MLLLCDIIFIEPFLDDIVMLVSIEDIEVFPKIKSKVDINFKRLKLMITNSTKLGLSIYTGIIIIKII